MLGSSAFSCSSITRWLTHAHEIDAKTAIAAANAVHAAGLRPPCSRRATIATEKCNQTCDDQASAKHSAVERHRVPPRTCSSSLCLLCAYATTGRPWKLQNRPVNIGRDDW